MTTTADTPDTFARRLQALMDAKGYNQTSLADKSGIERTCINRMLKGRKQPDPFQVGVLAQCFDVTPETLMAGIELPPHVQREVQRERERTERVLAAEAARDEAVARVEHEAREKESLQTQLESERREARRQREALDAGWQQRLKDTYAAHAADLADASARFDKQQSVLERAAVKLREQETIQVALRRQIAVLQQQLAQERSAKAGVGVLGGLVGMALGRAMD